MSGSELNHRVDDVSGRLLVEGDLEEAASRELREVVGDLTSGLTQDLTVDLSGVDFLPSTAVGVLATSVAGARRNGATIRLLAAEGTVAQRVLRICGLEYGDPSDSEPQPG